MTPGFIPPTLWHALNNPDYTVWEIMQEQVYKKIKDVGKLHQQTVEKWNGTTRPACD